MRENSRWHDLFYHLFRYSINLFYTFHCLSFPFLKGCRLEKGHIVPVLCSHSYILCIYVYIYIYIYIKKIKKKQLKIFMVYY